MSGGSDRNLIADLGLAALMDEVFRRVAEFTGEGGRITPYQITKGVLTATPAARHLTRHGEVICARMFGASR